MEKIQLTISGLLADLKNGLTRDDIGAKYNLNKTQVKQVFKHPKLKNKKTIKPVEPLFDLVDDTTAPQLELNLTATPAPEVEEPADNYTQVGVNLTDDTAEPEAEASQATPETTSTTGAW